MSEGNRNTVSKKVVPKTNTDVKKYKDTAFILKQSTRKTKMFANLGKITYGICIEYKAFPTASEAAGAVSSKDDLLYKIPSALLQTKTVERLVPYINSLTPIPIGEKMWETVNGQA